MEEQKSLDALLYRFKKLRYVNKIAGEYYSRKNKQIVIPSIIISAIASILSFLATSGCISEQEKEYFSRLNKTNNKVYIAPKVIVKHHQGTSSNINLIKNLDF